MPKPTTTKPRVKKKVPKKRPKKPGKPATPLYLRKRLDETFSWYVRLSHADERGFCKCYTCGHEDFWTRLQNGHFISRIRLKTRYRTDNCKPQCYRCNITMSGMQWIFGQRLDEQYGAGHAMKIYRLSKQKHSIDVETYKKWIEYYQSHVAAILARRIERNRGEHSTIPSRIIERIHIH